MGFESFRVELCGGRANCHEADNVLRQLHQVRLDPDALLTPQSICYLRDDGLHVIEVELLDAPVRISCRFTLCHPSSIDSIFLDFIRDLMVLLGMQVKICTAARPEHASTFSVQEFMQFSAITAHCIDSRRAEWLATFGTTTLKATTNEVHQRIVLPRCQPVIELP